jgi:hypothetical protein
VTVGGSVNLLSGHPAHCFFEHDETKSLCVDSSRIELRS